MGLIPQIKVKCPHTARCPPHVALIMRTHENEPYSRQVNRVDAFLELICARTHDRGSSRDLALITSNPFTRLEGATGW